MKLFCFSLVSVLLSCSLSSADKANKQYLMRLWQPTKGQSSLTPGILLSSAKVTNSSPGFTSDGTMTSYTVSTTYSYGVSDLIAAGLSLGFGRDDIQNRTTSASGTVTNSGSNFTGIDDIGVNLSGRSPVHFGAIYYGLLSTFSPGESSADGTTGNGNRATGGNTFTPYLAAHFDTSSNVRLGLKASYVYRGDRKRKETNPSLDYVNTGGSSISSEALIELSGMNWGVLGFTVGVTARDAMKYRTTGGNEGESMPAVSFLSMSSYADIPLSDSWTLTSSLGFNRFNEMVFGPGAKVGAYYIYLFSAGLRFVF